MTSCAFCGRDNDGGSRFCIDCGKPIGGSTARPAAPSSSAQAAAGGGAIATPIAPANPSPLDLSPVTGAISGSVPCPRCAKHVDPTLPFCGYCGAGITATLAPGICSHCGAAFNRGVDVFCARCGSRVGDRVSIETPRAAPARPGTGKPATPPGAPKIGPRLGLLGDAGDLQKVFTIERGEAVIGRGEADIVFEADHYMSPIHARVELRDGSLFVRDLGSRNGTWIFSDEPTKLTDGDLILVGSQILRFRRLGYPGPHPPEADSTRRMGSAVPAIDIAVVEQIRADGSVRDSMHLSPGRTITIGREAGEWIFPYDQTMSGRHAEIQAEDNEFYVHDAGSRNGVAMSVRGERVLKPGIRLLLGDQVLRVESV